MNAEIARFAALAVLMVGLFAWLRRDIRKLDTKLDANTGSLRADLAAKFDALRDDLSALRSDLSALRERMARLEGLLEGPRQAITRRAAWESAPQQVPALHPLTVIHSVTAAPPPATSRAMTRLASMPGGGCAPDGRSARHAG